MEAGSQPRKGLWRPAWLAVCAGLLAAAGLALGAQLAPGPVLIGRAGVHDGRAERWAACLDCHVPFVGSPGSRCTSPACHANLATGAPKRDGNAMPVRFHVALRRADCGDCHIEHATAELEFAHEILPPSTRARCVACHSGVGVRAHTPTDSLNCAHCHEVNSWKSANMDHSLFEHHHCDDCHVAPDDEAHAKIAGICTGCHVTERWVTVNLVATSTQARK